MSGRRRPAPAAAPSGSPGFVVDALAKLLATPGQPEDYVFAGPQGGVLRMSSFRSRFWRPAVQAAGPKDPDSGLQPYVL
jgi:hypothetical protein